MFEARMAFLAKKQKEEDAAAEQNEPIFVECPGCSAMMEITDLRCGTITHGTQAGVNLDPLLDLYGCGAIFHVTKTPDGSVQTKLTREPTKPKQA